MFSLAASSLCSLFFFFNDTATTEIYTLSLHDALPILSRVSMRSRKSRASIVFTKPLVAAFSVVVMPTGGVGPRTASALRDRKSTRLNSSHDQISYAVFCLKKKKNKTLKVQDIHHKTTE